MIDCYSSQGYRIIGIATKLLAECTTSNQAMSLSRYGSAVLKCYSMNKLMIEPIKRSAIANETKLFLK